MHGGQLDQLTAGSTQNQCDTGGHAQRMMTPKGMEEQALKEFTAKPIEQQILDLRQGIIGIQKQFAECVSDLSNRIHALAIELRHHQHLEGGRVAVVKPLEAF